MDDSDFGPNFKGDEKQNDDFESVRILLKCLKSGPNFRTEQIETLVWNKTVLLFILHHFGI